jgi:murein L,D-transpeptidase YafK
MALRMPSLWRNVAAAFIGAALLASCQQSEIPKHMKPVPGALADTMREKNMSETAPIFVRIFKESSELEVWKKQRDGKFALLKNYDVCKWSGKLGPKIVEGDRQAPEGFYSVTPAQMNPKSSYYLSFNIGFPNALDRALGRTGTHLMVHGACSSAGCYSMTNEHAGELFALARDSFRGGQRSFQIQAFPFRMTPQNMAKHRDNEYFDFWKMLKTGSDHFELTGLPPKIDVCDRRYVFNADADGRKFSAGGACPAYKVDEELRVAVAAKQTADETEFAEAVTRLVAEAEAVDEEERLARDLQLVAEAEAAEKLAAKEARSAKISKGLGVFARLLGRDEEAEVDVVIATPVPGSETAATPAIAFAPAAPPVPPRKPVLPVAAANVPTPAVEVPNADSATETTITAEMTPEIPAVGSFVQKKFLWPTEE